MTIEEKQRELDKAKWDKSVSLRLDACGSFNYCCNCDKNIKNPCAHAYSKFFNEELENAAIEPLVVENKVEPVKKTTTRKTTTKKETATKTTTKKTAEKKTTTKKSSK